MTQIQCLLIREGGSLYQDRTGRDHHFKPNDKGHHVADVADKDAVKLFLGIEGFELYDPENPGHPLHGGYPTEKTPPAADDNALDGPDLQMVTDDSPENPPLVLKDKEGAEVNLSLLSRADLVKWVNINLDLGLHPNTGVDKTLAAVREALK